VYKEGTQIHQNLWWAKTHPGTVLWQVEFLAECRNRKNSDSTFLKILFPFVDLVEFWYFRSFHKIVEGRVDILFSGLALTAKRGFP
jgi:hypothetical protein